MVVFTWLKQKGKWTLKPGKLWAKMCCVSGSPCSPSSVIAVSWELWIDCWMYLLPCGVLGQGWYCSSHVWAHSAPTHKCVPSLWLFLSSVKIRSYWDVQSRARLAFYVISLPCEVWFVAFLLLLVKWIAKNRPCGIRSRDSCFLLLITLCMTTLFNLSG